MAKHGRNCVLVSGVVLMICGIACLATAYSAQGVVEQAFITACNAMISNDQCLSDVGKRVCQKSCQEFDSDPANHRACIVDCQTSRLEEFSFSMAECEMELKNQSGCACIQMGIGAWSCDCEGQLLGIIQEEWGRACYIVGAVGFVGASVLTGLPAINVALRGSNLPVPRDGKHQHVCVMMSVSGGSRGIFRVTCYSISSALFFLPFLAVGAAFLVVGLLFHFPGPVKDYLDDCEAQLGGTVFGERAADVSADCGLSAFCDAIKALSGEVTGPAVAAGIPFAVAGLFMFAGVYACCCCSAPNLDQVIPDKYAD